MEVSEGEDEDEDEDDCDAGIYYETKKISSMNWVGDNGCNVSNR